MRTCELAGFGAQAEIHQDLLEWNYGEYELRRTEEIHAERRTGNCFEMAVPEARHRIGLARVLIES
jgi:broad specificity phosphatase PhoE